MSGISGTELGQAIRAARVAQGWNQTQLAKAVGVKQAAVSQWEAGLRTLDVPTLRALEAALGVSFSAGGISADAAYALGQASGELRAIGQMAADMSRQAFAAADRIAEPMPRVVESRETGSRADLAAVRPPVGTRRRGRRGA